MVNTDAAKMFLKKTLVYIHINMNSYDLTVANGEQS